MANLHMCSKKEFEDGTKGEMCMIAKSSFIFPQESNISPKISWNLHYHSILDARTGTDGPL